MPDSFFAIDGLLETFLTVLVQMEVFPHVVGRENAHYLPFLLSTTFLMEAIKSGTGRETAHEVVKEHAIAAVRALRDGSTTTNDFVDRLAADARLDLSHDQLNKVLEKGAKNTGAADSQTVSILKRIDEATASYPEAKDYRPSAIL